MTKKKLLQQLAEVSRDINAAPNNYWKIVWDVERDKLFGRPEADPNTYTVYHDCEMITVAVIDHGESSCKVSGAGLLRTILYQDMEGADRLPLKGDVWRRCP
jgi:hypothetical protein